MTSRRGDDLRTAMAEAALAAIGRTACPPLADALTAVTAAWRPIDRAAVDAQLDALARPLFTVEPSGTARARALARLVVRSLRPDPAPTATLWLDELLAAGRGHPVIVATAAAEVGRRAGWEVSVCSTPNAWHAGLLDDDRLWLVDATGTPPSEPAPGIVRRHCAHEVAFVVLTGLAQRADVPREAARARELRDRLALLDPPDHPGRSLLEVLWSPR
jgi:hypothetical protein